MTRGMPRVDVKFGYLRDRASSWNGRDRCGAFISFNMLLPNEEEMWKS